MIKVSDIKLPISFTDKDVKRSVAKKLNIPLNDIINLHLVRKSIDARGGVRYVLTVAAEVKNENDLIKKGATLYVKQEYNLPVCTANIKRPVCVVGFGPAGMFAALTLAQSGVPVLVIERGNRVEQRKKDVELFKSTGKLDVNSNVQFGEGGAGTFSDGKLHTGISDKRIAHVLETFVKNGAPEDILYDAAPHIGTDLLCDVVKNIRKSIIALGGKILFNAQMMDFQTHKNGVSAVEYILHGERQTVECDALVLAIGHSSRDTLQILLDKGVTAAPKAFAVGLRVEHPSAMINQSRYHNDAPKLPAADYKLVSHKGNRGVYSFCMCPGGEVIAAASEENAVCVNGMSLHARNKRNSNAALLVGVTPNDFGSDDIFAGVRFQRELEQKAFEMGGGEYKAPIQLVGDFIKGQGSCCLGDVEPTYKPGVSFARLDKLLPDFISQPLRCSFEDFEGKIKGYSRYDAVLTGVEARSSSPVRILRNEDMCSLSIDRLYPCGEGAGYAGGITSAAVDGIKCAEMIIKKINAGE